MVDSDIQRMSRVQIVDVFDVDVTVVAGGETPLVHPAAHVLDAAKKATLGKFIEEPGFCLGHIRVTSIGVVVLTRRSSQSTTWVGGGRQWRQARSKELA